MTGTFTAKLTLIRGLVLGALGVLCAAPANAQVLLAEGQLIRSKAGSYADLSGLKGTLENGAAANLLGGLGSAITYVNGDTFLALPDRGPNAVSYNAALDDTVSYINRFHTIQMTLEPNNSGSGLPFTLTPVLRQTTLLHSLLPLAYGPGGAAAGGVGRGAPAQNNFLRHYFTGRSDNFDPNHDSGFPFDARFDTEAFASPTTASPFSSPMSMARTSTSSFAPPANACAPSRCPNRSTSQLQVRPATPKPQRTPAAAFPTRAWRAWPSLPTGAHLLASCRTR